MAEDHVQPDTRLVSVGRAAALSGISPDTLRVWERRYGRPVPVRLPSGHRRYTEDQVRWLRVVAEAIAAGHRASKVVPESEESLRSMLISASRAAPALRDDIAQILTATVAGDIDGAAAVLSSWWADRPPEDVVVDGIAPLLTAVGKAWCEGSLGIRHEHTISSLVERSLASAIVAIDVPRDAPRVVAATLSGERHGLGLLVVSYLYSLHGVNVKHLGVDVPEDELIAAAREIGATGVAVSISPANGGSRMDRRVNSLRRGLPASTALIVGGAGARRVCRGPQGIHYFAELRHFVEALQSGGVPPKTGEAA